MRLHLIGLFAATLFISVAPALPIFAQAPATAEDNSAIVELFTVRDRLDESDSRLEDGSYYQSHTFEGTAGQSVIVEMVSEEFDTYLLLLDPDGNTIAENDDSSGTNSRIAIELPTTGRYTIWANSYDAGATGNYVLTLRDGNLLTYFQQQLDMHRQAGDRQAELETLQAITEVHTELQQYNQALEIYQAALGIAEEIGDRLALANIVYEIGDVHYDLEEYDQAIEAYQRSIEIYRNLENVSEEVRLLNEANALSGINLAYGQKGQPLLRLEYLQRELAIYRELGRQFNVIIALNGIGQILSSVGQYEEGIVALQEAIAVSQALGREDLELFVLRTLGQLNLQQGQYTEALEVFERALEIVQSTESSSLVITTPLGTSTGVSVSEAFVLAEIANVYDKKGDFTQALDFYQQALSLAEAEENLEEQERILNNVGITYIEIGEYQQAFQAFQTSLELIQTWAETDGEPLSQLAALFSRAVTLSNLGVLYSSLGDDEQALNYYQQALAIHRDLQSTAFTDSLREVTVLNNIGTIYLEREQYPDALNFFQQALEVSQELNAFEEQIISLNNIGVAYDEQGRYDEALKTYEQALLLAQQIRDRESEGNILNNIGSLYDRLENYSQAMEYYQQSLAINREIGDQPVQALTLSNLGYLLDAENQPEVAVAFLKESVNIYESIRGRIRTLDQGLQSSYTETVSHTYRTLADLLLEQGRILEAQQVLELLKVEELREFTRGTVLNSETGEIQYTAAEEEVLRIHGSLTELGYQLEQCEQSEPVCEQQETLRSQRIALTREYNDVINRLQPQVRERFDEDPPALNPEYFVGEAGELLRDKPNTILIYPVVLEDKLWVLWGTSGGIVNSIEVEDVNQQQLGEAVLQFRQLMEACEVEDCGTSNIPAIQAVAQEIYGYLIPPQLEAELEKIEQTAAENNQVPNLVFSLDRITRYIPMAALFDGDRYLVERFTISTILSAGQTRTNNPLPPPNNTSVLALGLSEPVPAIPDENIPAFGALDYVPIEIEAIVQQAPAASQGIYPGEQLLNQEFDLDAFAQLRNHHILHIATHGEFVPVRHDLSYLVLGTKQPLRIRQIEDMQQDFSHLSLVVLSACETALGDTGQDGIEINGIAHSIITAGANTVIASLWQVNDPATSALMQQFYGALAQGTAESSVTISQSLRQAQLSLINGDAAAIDDGIRGGTGTVVSVPTSNNRNAISSNVNYSHPYYWAPFILIGNGL